MDIAEIRSKIDEVDETLLAYFIERLRLAEEVARYKQEHQLPIPDKAREREVLQRAQERSGLYEPYAYELFHTVIELSKIRQQELFPRPSAIRAHIGDALAAGAEIFPRAGMVATQGVEGSLSQTACDKLLPRGNIVYVNTYEAVVEAVELSFCQFGVLPIESSESGVVRPVYELLRSKSFSIVRMVTLYDHKDGKNGYARFACVTKKPAIYAGADRISLILSCENEPGALCSRLSKLAAHGVNMVKLESHPEAERSYDFVFYLDIEASVREPGVLNLLDELESSSESCTFLGNYSVIS